MPEIGEKIINNNIEFTYIGYGVWEPETSASSIAESVGEITDIVQSYSNLARQSISDTAETIYVVPASTKTIVKDIHMCNNLAVDCHISIWIVPTGSVASNDNIMFYQWNIPANDFVHWEGEQALNNTGDYIVAQAEVADQITLTISGTLI